MITENLRIAMIGLASNRLRAALTMLGIIIGVAAVVSLLSVGQAFERFIIAEFTSVGTNLIVVFTDTDSDGEPFSNTEYELLTNRIYTPDVEHVVPIVPAGVNAVYGGSDLTIGVTGVVPEYIEAISSEVLQGRMFTAAEVTNRSRVTVISVDVAERLFNDVPTPVGESIRLGSVSFQVVGVLESEGGGGNGPGAQNDYTVLVPYTTAQTRLVGASGRTLTGDASITNFIITSVDQESADAAFEQIRAVLRIARDLEPGEEDDFTMINQTDLLNTLEIIVGLLTTFLGVLAGISLVVGGIGVMNIMLVTVTERTREIGLRKAVGARSLDIVTQFLVEAVTITLAGGLLGVVFSVIAAVTVSSIWDSLQVTIQASSVVLAVGISIAIGLFFGIYPAQRAANLNPIDALRSE